MSNLFTKELSGRQFNFQPFDFAEKSGYHVDVKDQDGTRWEFRLFKESEQWKMDAEKLPAWIKNLEQALSEAVEEHE